MKVCSFNIQNDFMLYKKDKAKVIYKFLKENDFDFLGLQEVFYLCGYDLKKIMYKKYNTYGKYRFILKLLHFTSNEKNPIITKYNALSNKTYYLPYKPSSLKRVLTHIVVKHNNKKISVYNTHLESDIDEVKEQQLKYIFDIIKKDKNIIILMGDFNLKSDNKIFINFINKLDIIGIKRIDFSEKTFKESKDTKEIDHIFISKSIEIKDKKVIKDLSISDHYPVSIEFDI